MGNIRPGYIKSLAAQIIEEHPEEIGLDFAVNKDNVTKYTNIESKVIRNRVAGYLVRQMRVKATRKR